MRRIVLLVLFGAAALASATGARAAGDDLLDTRFGGDGIVTAFPNGGVATAVGVDKQGQITAIGYTIERDPDVVVARFLPDGTPDTSFGDEGSARFDLGAADYAFDAAFTRKGGMAIVGRRTAKEDRMFVLQLGADGTPLPSFSDDGQVLIDAGTRAQSASAVAFTPHGRIVLGGVRFLGDPSPIGVGRLSATGTLDRGFGGDGIAVYDTGIGTEQINDVLVQPGGGVVAAGTAENSQEPRFSILRARSDGRLDDAFGRSGGYTLLDVANGPDRANALTTAGGGDYLLVGSSSGDWAIAAFTPSGTLDLAWGTEGHRLLPGDGTYEEATDIVPTDARMYVVGTVHRGTDDLGVARLRGDGKLDTSFSGDGRFQLDTSNTRDTGAAAVLQGNGKLVIAGQTWRKDEPRFLLVRLRAA